MKRKSESEDHNDEKQNKQKHKIWTQPLVILNILQSHVPKFF